MGLLPDKQKAKIWAAHVPGMLGTFSPPAPSKETASQRSRDASCHMPWCMSGSLTHCGGENVPGIPGACTTSNFTYLTRSPWKIITRRPHGYFVTYDVHPPAASRLLLLHYGWWRESPYIIKFLCTPAVMHFWNISRNFIHKVIETMLHITSEWLHFLLILTNEVDSNQSLRQGSISPRCSYPILLITWWDKKPRHQSPWYWPNLSLTFLLQQLKG